MTLIRAVTATSALALFATPAFADLTAEQVLDDLLSQVEMGGLTLEVLDRTDSPGKISIGGMSMTLDFAELAESFGEDAEDADGSLTVRLHGIEFEELGDGRVSLNYPKSSTIDVDFDVEGEEFGASMVVRYEDISYIASGSPERIRYDYSVGKATVGDLTIEAPEMEGDEFTFDFNFVAENMVGFTELGDGTVRDYTAEFAAGLLSFAFNASDMEVEDEEVAFSFSAADMDMEIDGHFAQQELMDSLSETILKGNDMRLALTHGALAYDFNISAPDANAQVSASIGSGDFNFSMDRSGLVYGGTSKESAVSVQSPDLPFPALAFRVAESGGLIKLPIVPSEEPQEFGVSFNMIGLEVPEMLWSMFDPGGQLPHDPANISVDISGKGILTEDFTSPTFEVDNAGEAPGTLEEITINSVELSFAGASLTGDGLFEFDNSFGIPIPSGTANMMLVGANGLMDTLVAMGLLPQEQAMGARMMLGLFARPGEGEDTLISTIEVKEDGQILANGQRLR